MANDFLTNKSLEKLIKETPLINEKQRKGFLERLPYLDREERIDLLKTLKNIILLDVEREEMVKKVRRAKRAVKKVKKAKKTRKTGKRK